MGIHLATQFPTPTPKALLAPKSLILYQNIPPTTHHQSGCWCPRMGQKTEEEMLT